MSEEMMNTKEVARYLDIHEKQVYALIKTKKIPASRVTGKWLFPKNVIDEWIEKNARSGLEQAREKSGRIAGVLLASGSNDQEVFTHIEVGLAILSGEADTGIATAAVSTLLGLDFVPITKERSDMICDQSTFFQKGVQALMEVLNGDLFRKRVANLGSYDFQNAGRIIYAKP